MAFSLTTTNPENLPDISSNRAFPVVALREGVVFPHTEAHLTFGRPKSAAAIETAVKSDKQIVFVAQRNTNQNPEESDLYTIGTLCTVEQVAPYGNELLALVKGISRVRILKYTETDPYFSATVELIAENYNETDSVTALSHQILAEFKNSFNLGKSVEFPVFMRLMAGVSASELADQVANALEVATNIKQEILETFELDKRLEKVLGQLVHETKVLELEKSISNKTHAKFERNMRQQILQERKRTIQEELEKMGAEDESEDDDISRLKKAMKASHMPQAVRIKADKELARLSQMSPSNPESNYIRTYLDWLTEMPWSASTKSSVSLEKAASILDADHYGLKKAKERILEYLAVMKLRQKQAAGQSDRKSMAILCFAGPPGVGKTSIGKSIAKALGRKFVRVSLGGIRDEAEIRGHRRTYVGAMPGRLIQGIKNSKSKNPVFMLDEIDKLASDYRGDPSSALLEALDPEQNKEFSDHYLEVPFDLSEVMFIATANMLENIPPALRDRMEIITFPGYTLDEKAHIAANHLWEKQLEVTGLPKNYTITKEALLQVIKRYTREAGVRDLERQLAKICRKLARNIAEKKVNDTVVDLSEVRKYLGPERLPETMAETLDQVGIVTGLSWSEAGGDILFIEVALMPGRGELKLTGQLGDVMKESAQAAYSYIRSKWEKLGLKPDFYRKLDIHIHVPEGAIPKDGPSAGAAITTALVSAFTNRPSRRDIAMTGEITLRGRVTEIGGVKEKVIAAHRAGIKELILPKDNEKDVIEDVPTEVRNDLKFNFVSHLDEVLAIALRDAPAPTGPTGTGDDRPLKHQKKTPYVPAQDPALPPTPVLA